MLSFKRILTVFLLSIFLVPCAYSQPAGLNKQTQVQPSTRQDYAMLIRKIDHLKAAIKTLKMMKENDANAVNHFEVVICGKGVTQLSENSDLIDNATQAGITLSACGMSLNKFSIAENELPQGVGVVSNGLIRMFALQEQGYKTISL